MILLMCANAREHHPSYSRGIHTQNADPSRAALPGCAVYRQGPAEEGSEAPGRLTAREAVQVPGSPKPGTNASWLTGTLNWQHPSEDG